jgi:hypothetical protein
MPLKPSYLILIGAGAIVGVSGLRGWAIGKTTRDVIAGQNPNTNPQLTAQITGANFAYGYGAAEGSTGSSGPVTAPTNASQKAWAVAQLAAVPAPPTPANINSLCVWSNREAEWNRNPPDGAQYTHNPLNTGQPQGSIGTVVGSVRIYPNWLVGIRDTALALNNGFYPDIVARLRSGKGLLGGFSSPEFGTWSGGGYDSLS